MREQKGELEKALPALREAEVIHRGAKGYEKEHKWWADAYFRVSYNAACEAAKAGKTKLALAHLKENIEWARKHVEPGKAAQHIEHAREKDADLKTLRGTPEFDALFR